MNLLQFPSHCLKEGSTALGGRQQDLHTSKTVCELIDKSCLGCLKDMKTSLLAKKWRVSAAAPSHQDLLQRSEACWPCTDIPLKTCMSPATLQIRQKQLCFISITLGFVNCHPYPSIGWSSLVCSPSFNMPISHCQTDYTDYSINILYSANGEEIVLFW